MIHTTRFSIGETVNIPELHARGKVKSIFISNHGTQYFVRYFSDKLPFEVYFYENELEQVEALDAPRHPGISLDASA